MSSKSRNLSQTSNETNKNISSVVTANIELQKLIDNVQSKVNNIRHEKVKESKAKEKFFEPITKPLKEISQSLSVPQNVKTDTLFEDLADQKLYKFTGADLMSFPFSMTPTKIKLTKIENKKKNVIPTPASTIKKEKPWEKTLQEELFENNLTKFNNNPPNFENQSISGINFDTINNAESSSARSSLGETKKRLSINPEDFSDISIDETDNDEDYDDNDDDDDDDDDDGNLTNELTPELVDFKATAKYLGCLLYTSPSPRDRTRSRMPSSA